MSLLAGIYFRDGSCSTTAVDAENLKLILKRSESNNLVEIEKRHFCLYALCSDSNQIEVFEPQNKKSLTVVAGNPLSSDSCLKDALRMSKQSKEIHDGIKSNNYKALERSRGEFCAVYYDEDSGGIALVSDKLTIRPLYYYINEKYVVFSSALWVMETFPPVPKVMDFRGVTETLYLGFPLGRRTTYSGISLLNAGEVLEIDKDRIDSKIYWHWDRIGMADEPENHILSKVHKEFEEAVKLRAGGTENAVAFLSGGLDSRCIVASLRRRNMNVRTMNFSKKDSLDEIYGRMFSETIGTTHEEFSWETDPRWSLMMGNALDGAAGTDDRGSDHPRVVWSGDGGSVGLGHVYLDEHIVEYMRGGDARSAVRRYLNLRGAILPKKMFSKNVYAKIKNILEIGILEELERIASPDPGRDFYLFLLLNDQRRHLANHFEDIDIHRLELVLPYFDFGFLSKIIESPIDLFLKHKFYNKWLNLFQKEVASVPWQSYPGHEPCPVETEIPDTPHYQWGKEFQQDLGKKIKETITLKEIFKILNGKNLNKILDTKNIVLASLATKAGLRDYTYIYSGAVNYSYYVEKCSGNIKL